MGLSIDLSAREMGIRTTRYGMIIDDLTVKYIGVSHSRVCVFLAEKITQFNRSSLYRVQLVFLESITFLQPCRAT